MSAFGDTSGFLAFLDVEDENHGVAVREMQRLRDEGATMFTTNYVVVETVSLLHHRFGVTAVRRLREDVLPVVEIVWVDASIHETGLSGVLAGGRRGPSLVDCTSLEVMRRLG